MENYYQQRNKDRNQSKLLVRNCASKKRVEENISSVETDLNLHKERKSTREGINYGEIKFFIYLILNCSKS